MTAQFRFSFPLQDTRMKTATHFTDLHVTGYAEIGRESQVREYRIKKISYFKRGENIGVDIAGLLQVINPQLFKRITNATENHIESILQTRTAAI